MIHIEGADSSSLAKVAAGAIAKPDVPMTVGQLERALLARFPKADAEGWDRMGLLAGDPSALVEGVAVALDATGAAIEACAKAGANVLLTHHPAFLEPPTSITPSHVRSGVSGANVYAALSAGVSLMNFHTALDVSAEAAGVLPGMLSLEASGVLVPLESDPARGYGQMCSPKTSDEPFKLAHLAARCTSVFGRVPRVWGDRSRVLTRIAIAQGAAGSVVGPAIAAQADCLVCGELRYHVALDAAQAGLAIVELGHDVSELPLAAVLVQAALDAGVPGARVTVIDQSGNWTTPDSTRI